MTDSDNMEKTFSDFFSMVEFNDELIESICAPDARFIRPSGNPMDIPMWKGMFNSPDVTVTLREVWAFDKTKIRFIAGGNVAVTTITVSFQAFAALLIQLGYFLSYYP